jgi:hypothetical protein
LTCQADGGTIEGLSEFIKAGSVHFVAGENQTSKILQLGLAFVAGTGLILMVITAAVGVISGEGMDSSALGLLFAAGTALLISGIVAWFAVVRPDLSFDDINEPMYHGHHDEH